jgi:uncharacterized protein YbaP (TraB family)
VRRALILLAVLGCQKHEETKKDPWDQTATSDSPTLLERHKRSDEVCPKVTGPWFFRIEKDGHTSYILGTRHIGISLSKFPQVVTDRIHDAKLAVFEIDPADKRNYTKPPPIDVAAALGSADWKHYTDIVGPGIAARASHGRPSLAILLASTLYDDLSVQLENEIQSELTTAHIPMRGLETSQFQDDLIEKLLDLRMLRAMVEHTKDRAEIEHDTRKSLARYCEGSEKGSELEEEDREKMREGGYTDAELDAFEDDLVYKRTASWVAPLEELFAKGDVFVAVGAGHVRGDRGLAKLLSARGWTVTRITQ